MPRPSWPGRRTPAVQMILTCHAMHTACVCRGCVTHAFLPLLLRSQEEKLGRASPRQAWMHKGDGQAERATRKRRLSGGFWFRYGSVSCLACAMCLCRDMYTYMLAILGCCHPRPATRGATRHGGPMTRNLRMERSTMFCCPRENANGARPSRGCPRHESRHFRSRACRRSFGTQSTLNRGDL